MKLYRFIYSCISRVYEWLSYAPVLSTYRADLFFDLTYVAAAFRLGLMLKADVSLIGIIDFIVLTVCMLDAWKFKTLHDSTFEAQDIVHKLVDVLYATTAAGVCVFFSVYALLKLEFSHFLLCRRRYFPSSSKGA